MGHWTGDKVNGLQEKTVLNITDSVKNIKLFVLRDDSYSLQDHESTCVNIPNEIIFYINARN